MTARHRIGKNAKGLPIAHERAGEKAQAGQHPVRLKVTDEQSSGTDEPVVARMLR